MRARCKKKEGLCRTDGIVNSWAENPVRLFNLQELEAFQGGRQDGMNISDKKGFFPC
jgi:hypothetical protein